MEIRRAFKERLYPNKEQEERLLWVLDQCRTLYNAAIEQRRHVHDSGINGRHLYPVRVKPEGKTPRRAPRPVTPAVQKRRDKAKAKGTAIEDGLRWRKGISYDEQVHDLVELKAEFPEFADVNAQILQNVCKRVDLAYGAYSDRKADYGTQCAARKAKGLALEPPPDPPHFKGKRHYSSFTYPNPLQGWKLEYGGRGPFPVRDLDAPRIPRSAARRELNCTYGKLVLSNVGAIKVRWSRPIEGTVKTITVKRDGPEWFVYFSCVLEVEQHAPPQLSAQAEPCPSGQNSQTVECRTCQSGPTSTRPATALDVGLEHYAMFEDGNRIENPRYYRKNEETLARCQRIVSTKVEAHRRETAEGRGSSLAAEPLRCRKARSGGPVSSGAESPSKESAGKELNGARRTKNLSKARAQVAKAHRKAKRRREYFHHVEAKKLIERVGAIGVEALSIDNMVRRPKPKLAAGANGSGGPVSPRAESPTRGTSAAFARAKSPVGGAPEPGAPGSGQPTYLPNGASAKSGLNKSINDAAWGTFLFILEYKAKAAGVLFVKVDPRGTSQVCSRCHQEVPKALSERWHICPHCALVMPRDQNSACEIYQRAGFGIPPALPDARGAGPSPGTGSVAAR